MCEEKCTPDQRISEYPFKPDSLNANTILNENVSHSIYSVESFTEGYGIFLHVFYTAVILKSTPILVTFLHQTWLTMNALTPWLYFYY